MHKLTYDYVKNFIEVESNSGCTLLSKDYISNSHNLIIKCRCTEIFEISFSKFKGRNQRNCVKCSPNYQMNLEEVIEYVSINAPTFKILDASSYKNGQSKILFECDRGHQYLQKWVLFKHGFRCWECHKTNLSVQRRTPMIEVFEYITSRNFEFVSWIDDYTSQMSKFYLKCNMGHIFITDTSTLKNKLKGCPQCRLEKIKVEGSPQRFSYDFVKNYIEIESKSNYKLLSETYKDSGLKLKFMCDKGHIFKMSFCDFRNENSRCPSCKLSKGEREIRQTLDDYNINYIEQYEFIDCKNILPLSFDFAILNKEEKLVGVVEFDGKQHFEPVEYFGGKRKYEEGKKNDAIKNKYCFNNNIFLLRIPYWDYSKIKSIIKDNFEDYMTVIS